MIGGGVEGWRRERRGEKGRGEGVELRGNGGIRGGEREGEGWRGEEGEGLRGGEGSTVEGNGGIRGGDGRRSERGRKGEWGLLFNVKLFYTLQHKR